MHFGRKQWSLEDAGRLRIYDSRCRAIHTQRSVDRSSTRAHEVLSTPAQETDPSPENNARLTPQKAIASPWPSGPLSACSWLP